MKPFIKRETIYDPEKLQKTKEFLQKVKPDLTDSQFADIIEMEKKAIIYSNDVYQVNIYNADVEAGWPEMWWLSIKRFDGQIILDWRDVQQIKNELVGPGNEGVQMFPDENRLVDTANQYHIWVLKDERLRFPFGMKVERYVLDDISDGVVGQRKINKDA